MNELIKLNPLLILVKVLLYVISCWVFIHFFAILGVFILVAYPVWWMFFPKQSICFSCSTRKDGDYCPLCKDTVDRKNGVMPKSSRSVALNSVNVLLVTIISLSLVYLEHTLLDRLGFFVVETDKTVSFVIPSKGQYRLGEIFPLKIEISGVKVPVNVVQADLGFDFEKLEVVEVSIQESFAKVFLQKEINNDIGYVRLTGGLPNPGLTQNRGILGTVYFKTRVAGLAQVKFLPTSLVLANDGRGTNVIKEFPEISYLVLPERISVEEEKLQEGLIKKDVLGATEEDDKLVFFDNSSSVLGAKDETVTSERTLQEHFKDHGVFGVIFYYLERLDHLVLKIYVDVLEKLKINIPLP